MSNIQYCIPFCKKYILTPKIKYLQPLNAFPSLNLFLLNVCANINTIVVYKLSEYPVIFIARLFVPQPVGGIKKIKIQQHLYPNYHIYSRTGLTIFMAIYDEAFMDIMTIY